MGFPQRHADISLVTSLYQGVRWLPSYARAAATVCAELRDVGLKLQIVVVVNDATATHRYWLNHLSQRLSEERSGSLDVQCVARETLYASWNRGLAAAKAPCLGFWNVDDVRASGALIEGQALVARGAELVYFPHVSVRASRRFGIVGRDVSFPVVPPFDRETFMRGMYVGPFFLFSRELYERVGPFDERFHIAGDFEWAARAAGLAEFTRGATIGGAFLLHGGTLSGSGAARQLVENNIVYVRYGGWDKIVPAGVELMSQYSLFRDSEGFALPRDVELSLSGRLSATASAYSPWAGRIAKLDRRLRRVPLRVQQALAESGAAGVLDRVRRRHTSRRADQC
jgi:hypothetical protein